MHPQSRRRFLTALLGLTATLPAASRTPSDSTPRQSAGPFYPRRKPDDDDANLVRVDGRTQPAEGDHTRLSGRVLDTNGRPLPNLTVEIWQCDHRGRYRHPRDPSTGERDPGFQGFGHAVTDADGRYRFATIRPVPYPGRTPHIHLAVRLPGDRPFVTQLYIRGEPRNEYDFLFRRVPQSRRHLVEMDFRSVEGEVPFAVERDLILDTQNGTPSEPT